MIYIKYIIYIQVVVNNAMHYNEWNYEKTNTSIPINDTFEFTKERPILDLLI